MMKALRFTLACILCSALSLYSQPASVEAQLPDRTSAVLEIIGTLDNLLQKNLTAEKHAESRQLLQYLLQLILGDQQLQGLQETENNILLEIAPNEFKELQREEQQLSQLIEKATAPLRKEGERITDQMQTLQKKIDTVVNKVLAENPARVNRLNALRAQLLYKYEQYSKQHASAQ